MCLDLSFINKFLISWGLFLTVIVTLHNIILTAFGCAGFFTREFLQFDFIQLAYVDSVIDILLALSLLKLFYYQGIRLKKESEEKHYSKSTDLNAPL